MTAHPSVLASSATSARRAVVSPPATTWHLLAACRVDTAVHFFPPNHFERKPEKDRRESAARAVCHGCPVRLECLEHALRAPEPYGIWGGLNELQRRRVQRRRHAG